MYGYLMNISVGGHSFLLKFNIRFHFMLLIFLQDIRGKKKYKCKLNSMDNKLTNIEKQVHPSSIHPSIHPSFLHGAMMGAAYIWPKKHLCLSTPPLLFFKKIENSSCRARGWYGWQIHMWMVNSHPYQAKFTMDAW